jgi:hypothetical protein
MKLSGDVLRQMFITAANGELVLLPDLRQAAAEDGRREEYEARRIDTLMRLGVTELQEEPIRVTDVSVVSVPNREP